MTGMFYTTTAIFEADEKMLNITSKLNHFVKNEENHFSAQKNI